MDEKIKSSLLAWLSGILQRPVSVSDIQSGTALVQLANLTEDVHLVTTDLTSPGSLEAFLNYLDTMFQFPASCLFDIPGVICGSGPEEEVFGVCMLVLMCCLQSRSRQRFMDAALNLDLDTQSVIFHLVHKPMTQVSMGQNLARECVLAGFKGLKSKKDPRAMAHQSTLAVLDTANNEETPIKSAQVRKVIHQSFRELHEAESISNGIDYDKDIFRKSWSAGQTVTCNAVATSSPATQVVDKFDILPSSPVFRVPAPVRPKKKSMTVMKHDLENDSCSEGPSDDDLVPDHQQQRSPKMAYALSPSTLPPPPLPISSGDGVPTASGVRHQRPTDLRLTLSSQLCNCQYRFSRNESQSNSLVDLSDITNGQKSNLPPASPLATLKNLLDSPLWTQKTRLREAERDKRRLLSELEKERAYRDEVENVVTELRNQLDEARQRATEAESRATRLSRDLVACQDQADELNLCRTELVMREDEIMDLKKRLNSFQDVLNHSRQLELANANLHQECADHKLKIEQLSMKLTEIKDRRMVCTEVETLRSKLRDVEAQLAQQLLERENAEKDARRQQELYSQLKLQQTVQEKRRARNARRLSGGIDPKNLGSQLRLSALHSGDEIECEDPSLLRVGSKDSVESSNSTTSKLKTESVPLRDGENLGSVLQGELRAAQEESSRLKKQLEETSTRLQKREQEINQLTERVQQLAVDLASSSTQCELTEQAAEQSRVVLSKLQTDLATLEGRLIWVRTMNEKSLNAARQSMSTDLIARLENTGIIDRIKGIGTGLSDSLNQLCQLFTSNLDDIWSLFMNQLSSLQSTITELRSTAECLKTALNQKEDDLAKVTNQLHDQTRNHAQQLVSKQSELTDIKRQVELLKQEQCTNGQIAADLQGQVNALVQEKEQLIKNLDLVKEQSTREMCQSREMLERATQRLQELEEQLEVQKNPGNFDVATQTEGVQGELPIPADVSPLTDSLCRSDMDENERRELDDDQSVVEEETEAYKALAADRRGLSDELVRLHNELADSYVDRCELKQQVMDLNERLINKEMELQRQTALFTRSQEQWVLAEREALDTKNQLAQLRANYAAELQALRAELLPHIGRSRSEASATAAHIEAVRLKYEAERNDIKNKLIKATEDLERLEVDRSRLIELNTSLQRELTASRLNQNTNQNTPNLVYPTSVRKRQQVTNAHESSLQDQQTPPHNPLEDWLETVTANNASCHYDRSTGELKANGYERTELSDCSSDLSLRGHNLESDADPRLTVTDSQLEHHKQRSESSRHNRLSTGCKSGLYARVPKQPPQRTGRRKPKRQMEEIMRQLERLTSTTAELETRAFTMQQNMNMHLQRTSAPVASSTLCALPYAQEQQKAHAVLAGDSCKAHSVSLGGPITNDFDQNSSAVGSHISAPVHFPSDHQPAIPVVETYGADTDADSSAFTDLSQVSSASRHGHPNTDQISLSSPHQQSPQYSLDLSQVSVPLRSDSAYSSRQTRATQPPQFLGQFMTKSGKVEEPNSKKSSFTVASPVEPDPYRIAELNRRNRLQPMHLRTSYPVETQSVNPEKIAVALRQLSCKAQSKDDPGSFRKPNSSVPLTTVPEEYGNVLREMVDENIVDNQSSARLSDPSCMRSNSRFTKSGSLSERSEVTARSTQPAAGYRPVPKNLNSITDALIAASGDESSMVAALELELARAALIGSKEEPVQQSKHSDPSQSSPTVSVGSANGSMHSGKQNHSIAFEILMEPVSAKSRRLPAPRANSSTIIRRVPGSRGGSALPASASQNCGDQFASAKLPLASTLPTPVQRNPKCLNLHPSGYR